MPLSNGKSKLRRKWVPVLFPFPESHDTLESIGYGIMSHSRHLCTINKVHYAKFHLY